MIVDSQVHVWSGRDGRATVARGRRRKSASAAAVRLRGYACARWTPLASIAPFSCRPAGKATASISCSRRRRNIPTASPPWAASPVELPESGDLLRSWLDQPGMLGVRLSFQHEHNRHFMTDGTVNWFWPAAEKYGIPVMLYAPHWLARVGDIAAQHPRLKIIIDHMGLYRQKDGEAGAAITRNGETRHSPEPVRESDVGAALFERELSLSQSARGLAGADPGLRAPTLLLGQRSDAADAQMRIFRMPAPVHRGTRFFVAGRSGLDHGAGNRAMSRMARSSMNGSECAFPPTSGAASLFHCV